jgi:hypothetical protein
MRECKYLIMNQVLMMYKIGRCLTTYFIGGLTLFLVGCGGSGSEDSESSVKKPALEFSSSTSISSTSIPSAETDKPANSYEPSSAASSKIISSSTGAVTKTSVAASSAPVLAYERSRESSSNAAIVKNTDITPPSGTTLFPHKFAISSLTIIWDHATDNVGVYEYEIERDGKLIATLEFPSFVYADKGLAPNTFYTYTIRARDEAGNLSVKSNELKVRTLALAGTTSKSSVSSALQNSSISSRISTSQSSLSSRSSVSSAPSSKSSNSVQTSSSKSQTSSFNTSSSKISSSKNNSSSSFASTALLQWQHPTHRANGEYLELQEIGGYELRHKRSGSSRVTYYIIEGYEQTDFVMTDLKPGDSIDVAVYDADGLYSEFIPIYPQ